MIFLWKMIKKKKIKFKRKKNKKAKTFLCKNLFNIKINIKKKL